MISSINNYHDSLYFEKEGNQLLFFPEIKYQTDWEQKVKVCRIESERDQKIIYAAIRKYGNVQLIAIIFALIVCSVLFQISNGYVIFFAFTAIGIFGGVLPERKKKQLSKRFEVTKTVVKTHNLFWVFSVDWKEWIFIFILIFFTITIGLITGTYLNSI